MSQTTKILVKSITLNTTDISATPQYEPIVTSGGLNITTFLEIRPNDAGNEMREGNTVREIVMRL